MSFFKLPEPYTDGIHTVTKVRFNWNDRIRILFGGIAVIEVDTLVEHTPGKLESKSNAWVIGGVEWPVKLTRLTAIPTRLDSDNQTELQRSEEA